jgi:hypothetical protein
LLNGGYLVALEPGLALLSGSSSEWPYRGFGCTPYLVSSMLFSFEDARWYGGEIPNRTEAWNRVMPAAAYGSLVLAGYAIAAALLTWRSVRRFDVVSERPRRPDPDCERLDTVGIARR